MPTQVIRRERAGERERERDPAGQRNACRQTDGESQGPDRAVRWDKYAPGDHDGQTVMVLLVERGGTPPRAVRCTAFTGFVRTAHSAQQYLLEGKVRPLGVLAIYEQDAGTRREGKGYPGYPGYRLIRNDA